MIVGADAERRGASRGSTAPPAAVEPSPPNCDAEALDQRLGDVVVRRLVHLAHDRRRSAATATRDSGVMPVGREARAGRAGDLHARVLERLLERLGGEAGRAGLEVGPRRAGAAVVEGQRAERADLAGEAIAGGRDAAEGVEGRLVADHAARRSRLRPAWASCSASAARPRRCRTSGRRRRAGRCCRRSCRSRPAGASARTVVVSRPVGAVAQQRAGGRVELLDRGRHALDVGLAGVELLARCRDRPRRRPEYAPARAISRARTRLRGGEARRPARGSATSSDEERDEGDEASHASSRAYETRRRGSRSRGAP